MDNPYHAGTEAADPRLQDVSSRRIWYCLAIGVLISTMLLLLFAGPIMWWLREDVAYRYDIRSLSHLDDSTVASILIIIGLIISSIAMVAARSLANQIRCATSAGWLWFLAMAGGIMWLVQIHS